MTLRVEAGVDPVAIGLVGGFALDARARAAGFTILAEPETQFYGQRTYRCRDPEGHIWTIGQAVRTVTREEAEKATGLKIEGWV